LLGISTDEDYVMIRTPTKNKLKVIIPANGLEHYKDLPCTYHKNGMKAFIQDFNKVNVTEDIPAHFFVPNPDEAFDLLMIFYNQAKPSEPIVLFIDFKSRVKVVSSHKDVEGYIPNIKQFQQVEKIEKYLKKTTNTKWNSNVIKSIAQGNYLYITLTAHHGNSFSQPDNPNLLIANNENASKTYFSFFYPLYQALRASI